MALPAITVSRLDVARLEALLATAHGEVADGLEEELLRATVVAPEDMPADVVTMNSRIRCREQARGREMCLTLVYPQDSGPNGCRSWRRWVRRCLGCRWGKALTGRPPTARP